MKRIICVCMLVLACMTSYGQKLKRSVVYEKLQRNAAALPVLGRIQPVPSDLDRPSYWSVGCETLDRGYGNFEQYRAYLKGTGVGYGRIQSGWAQTEKEKGVYDFEWLDKIVDGMLEEEVHPWMCLCYGNNLYEDAGGLGSRLIQEEATLVAWEKYVKAVVKRYKDKITLWEVWNEPDLRHAKEYDAYAKLLTRTAKAIKSVDSKLKVAGFSLAKPETEYAENCLNSLKKYGGLKYIDYATFHAYFPNPDLIKDVAVEFQKLIDRYDPRIKILQGEVGCPAQLEYGHALMNREWTETCQVKWDTRQMLSMFSIGVPSSVFTMTDLNYGTMIQSFGLVRANLKGDPQYLRPKYYGVQNVASIVTTDYVANNDIKVTSSSTNKEITIVGMEKDSKVVGFFLWFGGEVPSDAIEREIVNLTVEGAELKDPVYVDMITGKIHNIKPVLFRGAQVGDRLRITGIPLWDGPILIINRSEINMGK